MASRVFDLIGQEELRQATTVELIASENFVSSDVLRAVGSCLTNKYSEGYPAHRAMGNQGRYYGGCHIVDELEEYCVSKWKEVFSTDYHVNVQPHSGASANYAVYQALCNVGDTVMGMNLDNGGHLTHGSPVNYSGINYKIVPYGVDPKTHRIDYDQVRDLAKQCKPKMIIAGASAYPRVIDFAKFREVADAVGAYLTVMHESTAGVMIAASIVMGRALAPIDQAMATYKQSLDARSSYRHLKKLLDTPPVPPVMDLPAPAGELTAENLFLTINGRPLVRGVSFRLPAGQSLAIIGPSAAGKSTLCKLLLSIWAPTAGKVRIDRADIHSWDSEKLGPYIGYLPQDVELFAGSVAENIARMGDVDSQKVIAAAQMAGVHTMVLGLPKGYDTQIGEHGAALSGGQRQRIGLARALYGDPRLVVLDEPNSNLDEEGEQQLARAVLNLKQRKATVVLVTHKPSILNIVDNIIVMQEGQIALSGPRQAVLEKLAAMRHQQEQAAQARVQQEKLARQQALQKQQEALQKTQEAGGNA